MTAPGVSFSYADDPTVTNLVTRLDESGHRQVDLIVSDMRCASCGHTIEESVKRLSGVEEVQINAARHHVQINYDPSELTLAQIMDTIEAIGYTPTFSAVATQDAGQIKEKRSQLKRLGVAGIAMMQVMMFAIALYAGDFQGMEFKYRELLRWVSLLFTTPVVFYSALPFFYSAWRSVKYQLSKASHGKSSGLVMDIPVALAIASAYGTSVYATLSGQGAVYFDSVTMFTFFLLGARYLDQRLRYKLTGDTALADLFPDQSLRLTQTGIEPISSNALELGDLIRVTPGSMIPADGIVVSHETEVDESALTGESQLVKKYEGSRVFAGTLNMSQATIVRVSRQAISSRMADIARLAERATLERPEIVSYTDAIARYFVAFVLLLAASAYIAWSLIEPDKALWVTLAVLVVSCPCALSLATPAAVTAATMSLKRVGFICTRGYVLERLASATDVVFDKTGTLTGGNPEVVDIETFSDVTDEQALSVARLLEQHANHPIAQAFSDVRLVPSQLMPVPEKVKLHPSQGIEGAFGDEIWRIGNAAFCGHTPTQPGAGHSRVFLCRDKQLVAVFHLRDGLRGDSLTTIEALHDMGLTVRIYSGDDAATCEQLRASLPVGLANLDIRGGLTPENKLKRIQTLQSQSHEVVMVGDGINDVPGLSAASLSISPMGATDLARTKSDALLLSKGLLPLVLAIQKARKTRRVIRENLTWALSYNLVAIPLAALALIQPWIAALGMSASSLIVTLNSIRLSKTPSHQFDREQR